MVVKCSSCSLVYLGNPPEEEALYEDYYGASVPRAASYRPDSDDPGLRELYAINEQRIRRIKRLKPTGRLLDVGCGRGYFVKTANEHSYASVGIDVSARAVAYASREFGVRADVLSTEEMAGSGERYDVVTLWHVLEHFIEPYEALAHVRTVLKDDGICVIEVPNLHSLKFIISKSKWEGGNHPLYHRTFFTPATLRDALIQSGFSRVRRVRWSYHVRGRSAPYEWLKHLLDLVGMDAFLDFVAWR